MIFNRDLNLLYWKEEMCKAQIAEKKGMLLRNWQKKIIKENCPANRKRAAYLREYFKFKEVRP